MLSLKIFNQIWRSIQSEYWCGKVVSERDLQAQLYYLLRNATVEPVRIIVEPVWVNENQRQIPDIVITNGKVITDIFELKFVPYALADAKGDLAKLIGYTALKNRNWPVSIVPETGSWREGINLATDCRLHFVAISQHTAEAVWPESLHDEVPNLAQSLHKITHWYGRVRGNSSLAKDWGVEQCI